MEKENQKNILNIALVGCGRIANKHIEAILSLYENFKICVLCDPNRETAELAKKKILSSKYTSLTDPPKIYINLEDLLKDFRNKKISLDLVVIASPSGLHPKQVIDSAKEGLNVCTEKPMAIKFSDGIKMVKEYEKNKVKLFVVKQLRFNKAIQYLKNQIAKGRFGKISLVNVNVYWQRPQFYYDQEKWRGTKEFDGGALMNQASHFVDLLCWLFGDIESISSYISTIGRNIEVEDTAVVNIRWIKGILGNMSVTMLTYPNNIEGSITILGTKGSLKIGGQCVNNIEYCNFEDINDKDIELVDKLNKDQINLGGGHKDFYEDIFYSLINNRKPLCDGNEGLKVLRFLMLHINLLIIKLM